MKIMWFKYLASAVFTTTVRQHRGYLNVCDSGKGRRYGVASLHYSNHKLVNKQCQQLSSSHPVPHLFLSQRPMSTKPSPTYLSQSISTFLLTVFEMRPLVQSSSLFTAGVGLVAIERTTPDPYSVVFLPKVSLLHPWTIVSCRKHLSLDN